MVTEELGCGYRRTWNKIVTEELRIQWLQIFDQNGYRRNWTHTCYRKAQNTMVTGLGSERLQKNWEQNGHKITYNTTIKEYLRRKKITEELGTKMLWKPS